MSREGADICFEPVAESHLPMLHEWLKQPHVRRWWGDPDEELKLIRSILTEDDGTVGFVAFFDGKPAGYVQSWRPANFKGTHWADEAPWLRDVPVDNQGVDIFIGPAELITKGVGPAIVRAFARKLFEAGAPRLIIDPDTQNKRAVRSYEKAGFKPIGRHNSAKETTLLMELTPKRFREDGTHAAAYRFRELSRSDLPMIGHWLHEPHVTKWWGEPAEGLAEIEEAIDDVATEALIVELDGMPIAYLQSYDPHLEDDHPYRDQPVGTLGLDLTIGVAKLVGIGHGSAILTEFVDHLFARGTPRVIIDPDPANARAIRCYEKAGFEAFDTRTSIYGPALMMARDAPGLCREA